VSDKAERPCIYVFAGTNGAGKSSVGGATFREEGADYFNPDEAARRILSANPGVTPAEANSAAWHEGRRLLERAIAERLNFAFETTLGGHTITSLLESATLAGLDVRIWYVGLATPELHIARVQARVEKGGHPIPEATIRGRFNQSRLNLIQLMPNLAELRVYDNSAEADPHLGFAPQPQLLLHMIRGRVVESCDIAMIPDWAKPLIAVAIREPYKRPE
jgi:predicted ABC-type ATPase